MNITIIKMVIYFSMTILFCATKTVSELHPIILIPGSGGNQLEAKLTSKYKPSSLLCNRWYPINKDPDGWFRLWFDPTVLFGPYTKCFNQRMKIYYDPDKDDYYNAPGVETRVPIFGSTQSLLYLDPHLKGITSYMEPLVKSLEEVGGYVSGENLFGAPYDFRYGLAAKGHLSEVGSKFLSDLKELIETASNSNKGKPVILLSHSLGGLFALQLLNRNPISWRQKYIKHFIALSAPWGGTIEAMSTFASGNSFGVPLVNPLLVREEQRSCSSNLWLMPSPKLFKDDKLVITPNGSYSSLDINQFLRDIGFVEGVYPYKERILPLVERLQEPLVNVTCIVGSGVKTTEKLIYEKSGFDERPEVVYGDGDGTVNMKSLLALESAWNESETQSLKVIKIDGISHTTILSDNIALDRIINEISSINSGISISTTSSTY